MNEHNFLMMWWLIELCISFVLERERERGREIERYIERYRSSVAQIIDMALSDKIGTSASSIYSVGKIPYPHAEE